MRCGALVVLAQRRLLHVYSVGVPIHGCGCAQAPLTWGSFSPGVIALGPFDLMLASDVLYESSAFDAVFSTVRYFMDKNAAMVALIGYQIRRCVLCMCGHICPCVERAG